MNSLTKKHIIVAVILAVLGIAAVLIVLRLGQGQTVDKRVLLWDTVEYTGKVYTTDDIDVPLSDGETITLTYMTYLQDQKELQFGFSLPVSDDLKNVEPFFLQIVDSSTGEVLSERPMFIVEERDGRYYYRAIFSDINVDVEASPDLILNVSDMEQNEQFASQVIITAKTIFTETNFDSIEKLEATKDTSESSSESSESAA